MEGSSLNSRRSKVMILQGGGTSNYRSDQVIRPFHVALIVLEVSTCSFFTANLDHQNVIHLTYLD